MKELVNIQAKLRAPKSQENKFGHYSYRRCEDILEAVKPLLLENGCTLVMRDDVEQIGDRFYIRATVSIMNSDGDEMYASALAQEGLPQGGMSPAQGTGSASSYARKYALCGLFAIDDNKDPDDLDTRLRNNAPQDRTAIGAVQQNVQQGEPSPLAKAIAEVYAVQSRKAFEDVMRKYMPFLNEPNMNKACQDVAKKYPKAA